MLFARQSALETCACLRVEWGGRGEGGGGLLFVSFGSLADDVSEEYQVLPVTRAYSAEVKVCAKQNPLRER